MKLLVLSIISIIGLNCFSQNIQVGVGYGFDLNVGINGNEFYSPNNENINLTSLDFSVKFPMGEKFNFTPLISFNIVKGEIEFNNNKGTDIFSDDTISVNYSTVGNGWSETLTSEKYLHSYSNAEMTQLNVGGFITYNITNYLEFGTGIFIVNQKYNINDYNATDEYLWFGSTGTEFDNYAISKTLIDSEPITKNYIDNSYSLIPAIVKYTYNMDKIYFGASAIGYFGKIFYSSFRISVGVNIDVNGK